MSDEDLPKDDDDDRFVLTGPLGLRIVHREGEPVFTLRAQDAFAPETIEKWADRLEAEERRQYARNTFNSGPYRDEYQPSQKVRGARALAHRMRAWQELNDKKVPD